MCVLLSCVHYSSCSSPSPATQNQRSIVCFHWNPILHPALCHSAIYAVHSMSWSGIEWHIARTVSRSWWSRADFILYTNTHCDWRLCENRWPQGCARPLQCALSAYSTQRLRCPPLYHSGRRTTHECGWCASLMGNMALGKWPFTGDDDEFDRFK